MLIRLGEHVLRTIKKDIARDYSLGMVPEAGNVEHDEISNDEVQEYIFNVLEEHIEQDYFLSQYWKEEKEEYMDIDIEEAYPQTNEETSNRAE